MVENLTRLVNNRNEIESFIPLLLPGIQKVVDTASLPEVRELAEKALIILREDDEPEKENKFSGRMTLQEGRDFLLDHLKNIKADDSCFVKPFMNDETIINYMSKILTVDSNVNDWKRLEEFLTSAFGDSQKEFVQQEFIHNLRALFYQEKERTDEDEGIEIVNTDFSLAYGSRMLLNKTNLRLLKGHRYGLCGRNGAGKSTLMRAIANGQLDGFPDKDTYVLVSSNINCKVKKVI